MKIRVFCGSLNSRIHTFLTFFPTGSKHNRQPKPGLFNFFGESFKQLIASYFCAFWTSSAATALKTILGSQMPSRMGMAWPVAKTMAKREKKM